MTSRTIESCCRCGTTIDIRNFTSYHVSDDYRLICERCYRAERSGASGGGEKVADKEARRPPEKKN